MKYLIPILLYALSISTAYAVARTALVIGNSAYKVMPLANPQNDAKDMASKLQSLGFEVIFQKNRNKKQTKTLIREFGQKLKQKGGVGLFFYAGHGLQVDGNNYLVPIDFNPKEAYEVTDEAIDANLVTKAMEAANNPMNIVVLDACRDNPFPRKTRSSARGLARMNSASGTIIAYSTGPGDVAVDGVGRNSPYTSSLLKYMGTPGLTIEQVFKRVRVEVEDATSGSQLPWETSSLRGDFYFSSKPKLTIAPVARPLPAALKTQRITPPQHKPQVIDKNSKKLSIFTNPENSTITLLNNPTHYSMGVRLKPGDYRIEVSKEGYSSKKQWISIDNEDLEIQITLVPE